MTRLLLKETCPHERVGPLPYDGTPADPDEWECLDCGAWNTRDVGGADDMLDQVAAVFGVPPATFGAPAGYVYDHLANGGLDPRALADMMRKYLVPVMPDPATASFSSSPSLSPSLTFENLNVSEALLRLGAVVTLDPLRGVVVMMDLLDPGSYDAYKMVHRAVDLMDRMGFLGVRRELELRTRVSPDDVEYRLTSMHDLVRRFDHSWRIGPRVLECLRRSVTGYLWEAAPQFVLGSPVREDVHMRDDVAAVLEFA